YTLILRTLTAIHARRWQTSRLLRRDVTDADRIFSVRPDDLLTWVREVPFRPFRMCLNSGQTYEIRHPEMLKVGRSSVNIYSYVGKPEDPYEQMEMVGLLLIER